MNRLYQEAGINIDKATRNINWLQDKSKATPSSLGKVLDGIGGFAASYQPNLQNYQQPVLVSCTDGVGTKLALAKKYQQLSNIGIDLVAMCVNDLYTTGARPLFFLDYLSCNQLDEQEFQQIMTGILQGLQLADCPLVGGETAELPSFYQGGRFDVAGFVVGVVDRCRLLGAGRVTSGDRIVALPSSGFHSNGFTLISSKLGDQEQRYSSQLLTPTTIYHQLPELAEKFTDLHAVAHVTGGGLAANLQRVLPSNCGAELISKAIVSPPWMLEVTDLCGLENFTDAHPVFNMGVGMLAIVAQQGVDNFCGASGGYPVGRVVTRETGDIIWC